MKHVYTTRNTSAVIFNLFWRNYRQTITILLFLSVSIAEHRPAFSQSRAVQPATPATGFKIEAISPLAGCPGRVLSIVPKSSNDNKNLFTAAANYTITFSGKISGKTETYATIAAAFESTTLLKVKLPKLLRSNVEIANNSLIDITVTQTLSGVSVSDIKQNAFTYQVDNTKPVITATPAIKANTDAGQCAAGVTLLAPTASDNCSEALVTNNLASLNIQVVNGKAVFPKGITTVIWTATDGSGNTATSEQIVTVSDNQAPAFKVSQLPVLSVHMDMGVCSAAVELIAPEATDNCGIALVSHNQQTQGKVTFQKGLSKVTWTATDASGNTATIEQQVEVIDHQAPSIIVAAAEVHAVAETDLCSAVVSLEDPSVSDNCAVASTISVRSDAQVLSAPFPVGTTTITYTVVDVNGNKAQAEQKVVVKDMQKPVISGMPANITVVNDAGKCAAVVMWAAPLATDNCSVASFTSNLLSGIEFGLGEHTVIYTAVDASGNEQKASFTVTVTNLAPVVSLIVAPVAPVHVSAAVAVQISFDDTNLTGAVLNWGDGRTSHYGESTGEVLTLAEDKLIGNHTYAAAGFYKLTVTLTDACGVTSAPAVYEYVTIFNPNAGFVTGGGWFESPKGAYTPLNSTDADVTGKATYSFVAKYKGTSVVEGNTQFHFAAGNLRFKSSSYEAMRLIVMGGEVNYKGKGTINGEGEYNFLLSATDGQFAGATGADKVRMKIWDAKTNELVYDNQPSSTEAAVSATVINGGSIVVHTTDAQMLVSESATTVSPKVEVAQVTSSPNPFTDKVTVTFESVSDKQIQISVLNMQGAAVYQKIFSGINNGTQVEIDLSSVQPGIYYLQSVQGTDRIVNRIVKL